MGKTVVMQQSNLESNLAPSTRYEDDYSAWIESQVALLRAGRLADIDAENIAEELGDMGKSEFREFVGNLTVLVHHQLKWDYQPERRSRSWLLTIREHRRRVQRRLSENPSFVSRLRQALEDAHVDGRDRALDETGLPDAAIPEVFPYTFDGLMTREIALSTEPER